MKHIIDDNIRESLARAIVSVPVGHFLQIERKGRQHPRSMLAVRYTGDVAAFTREVLRMYSDLVGSASRSQTITIRITEN